jgi:DNA mismatch repair protein MutS
MFEIRDDKIRDEIKGMEIDNITPMEALNKLNELKKKVKNEKRR